MTQGYLAVENMPISSPFRPVTNTASVISCNTLDDKVPLGFLFMTAPPPDE
jgi:hypothetical protein